MSELSLILQYSVLTPADAVLQLTTEPDKLLLFTAVQLQPSVILLR